MPSRLGAVVLVTRAVVWASPHTGDTDVDALADQLEQQAQQQEGHNAFEFSAAAPAPVEGLTGAPRQDEEQGPDVGPARDGGGTTNRRFVPPLSPAKSCSTYR